MSIYFREVVALSNIAIPLIAAYLAELAMLLVTQMIVGRIGYVELAAVGLASHVAFEVLLVSMGLLSVVGVLIAQCEANADRQRAGYVTRQGLILAGVISLPCMALVVCLPWLLGYTGQDPQVIVLIGEFITPFALGVPAVFMFSVLRSFMAATSRTLIVMVISVCAVGLHYGLTVALVHGGYGLPKLGVSGAGWSITIVNWFMLIMLSLYLGARSVYRDYGVFHGHWRWDHALQRELFHLGLPVAGLVFLESGLFMAVAILSGVLGAVALAASEILLAWVSFAFVFALGIAEAAMVRVAYSSGDSSPENAHRAGMTALAVGIGLSLILVLIPLLYPTMLVNLFLDRDDGGYADVSALVLNLLLIVMVFQLFDGMQVIAARSLRALKDTMMPLWLAAFGYWVLGIGGGSMMCFVLNFGATGLWVGLAIGLSVTAVLLTLRFRYLTRSCGLPGWR